MAVELRSLEAAIILVTAAVVVALAWHGAHADGVRSAHEAVEAAALMGVLMAPLAGPSASVVAERSLRRRRPAAVAEHVGAFVGSWCVAALACVLLVWIGSTAGTNEVVVGLAAVLAAVWQLSGRRARMVDRCSRVRVSPPTGWRADVGCLAGGVHQGTVCIRTCWAPMLVMAAAPSPAIMAVVLVAMLWEWAPGPNPFARARRRPPAVVYASLALAAPLVAA